MTIRDELEQREARRPGAAGGAQRRHPRPAAARGRGSDPAGVPAGSRPHHPHQGVPPAEAQDAGVLLAGRRSLPHAPDPHARGVADCPHDRQGAAAARGADRSDRARPRPRPHAVRPRRRAGAADAEPDRLQSLRAEPAHRRRARARSPGPESDVGSARRHRPPFEGQARPAGGRAARASRLDHRGAGGARGRHRRLREPRRRRRRARRDPARGAACRRRRWRCSAGRPPSASAAWSPTSSEQTLAGGTDRDPHERRDARGHPGAARFPVRRGLRERRRHGRVRQGRGHPGRAVGAGAAAAGRLPRSADHRGRRPRRGHPGLHRRHDRPLRRRAVRAAVHPEAVGRARGRSPSARRTHRAEHRSRCREQRTPERRRAVHETA